MVRLMAGSGWNVQRGEGCAWLGGVTAYMPICMHRPHLLRKARSLVGLRHALGEGVGIGADGGTSAA